MVNMEDLKKLLDEYMLEPDISFGELKPYILNEFEWNRDIHPYLVVLYLLIKIQLHLYVLDLLIHSQGLMKKQFFHLNLLCLLRFLRLLEKDELLVFSYF